MINDALDLFKFSARQIRKATGAKITLAQETLARELKFQNFHEARKRLLEERADQYRPLIAGAQAKAIERLTQV
jgi:hypothetical protein|uniref:Uncharacterized protein n=1 Tax=Myoviridae sp. ctshb19 TaxID=2825194 RepID=A0A8S5UG90_9CAUD|nr:MAG TPA: hypothetical protein [Myoviridae sp. ctshb19]